MFILSQNASSLLLVIDGIENDGVDQITRIEHRG
jgi:hypothetical protein